MFEYGSSSIQDKYSKKNADYIVSRSEGLSCSKGDGYVKWGGGSILRLLFFDLVIIP
jgi:hypothetical protein